MKQICSSIINENGDSYSYYTRSILRTQSVKGLNTALTLGAGIDEWFCLLAIKLKPTALDSIVKPIKLTVLGEGQVHFAWKGAGTAK